MPCFCYVAVMYTFVLLAIAVWPSRGGGPCIYNPNQRLAVGCENVDKCRRGDENPYYCCAAVEHCASINLYAYKENPEFFVMCSCGRFLIVPCPEDHEFDPVLNRCKHRKTGVLHVVVNLATGVLQ